MQQHINQLQRQLRAKDQSQDRVGLLEQSLREMKLENALVKRENATLQEKQAELEAKVRKLEKELGLVRLCQSSTDKDTLVLNEKMITLELKLEQSLQIQHQQTDQLLKHQGLLKSAQ